LAPGQPGSGESQAALICGENAKQTINSGMRSEPRCEDAWFVEFLKFALNDVIFSRIIFFIIRGFLARVVFWECAQLRTNPIVGCCGLLTMSGGSSLFAPQAE
jgi:hypothetical protein